MTRTVLAIVAVDDAGRIVGTDPGSFREYEEWTPEEFDRFRADALTALETAALLSETARRNEARLRLVLDAAAGAGVFRGGRVDLSPVLRPYFDAWVVEYEQRRRLSGRIGKWLGRSASKARHLLLKIFLEGFGAAFRWAWRELQQILKK